MDSVEKMEMRFYIDGSCESITEIMADMLQPIRYIGNSRAGDEPFGVVADLKVYPYVLKANNIKMCAKYHDDLEFDMADKFHLKFIQENICANLIKSLECGVETAVIQIIKALTRMATKKECRAEILAHGGLQLGFKYINHKNSILRFELWRFLANLQ